MSKTNIPLFKVFMADDAIDPLSQVLQSGYIGQGPKVDEFEKKLSEYFQTPYVTTVNSATSGLHLALDLIKRSDEPSVEGRDEVITTPLTCTATNFPILANGLRIKWADIDQNTCNIDLDDVQRKITSKTLAIMVVHWGGLPVDLNKLKNIVDKASEWYGHKIHIIEDCAHAFGSKYQNKMVGSSGNYCVFSFQAIKHLTTGDGGLLISPTKELHEKANLRRWFGLDRTSSADFRCEQNIKEWGFKFHMNDIAASIGLSNFKHINWIVEQHAANYETLQLGLEELFGLKTIKVPTESFSSSWIMTLLVEDRDNFMRKMKEHGIGVSRVHDRNDKHECLKEYRSFLPTTDIVCSKMCCIPCGWWLKRDDLKYMIDCIKEGW